MVAAACALGGCATARAPDLWTPGTRSASAAFAEAVAILGLERTCRTPGADCARAIEAARGPILPATRLYAAAEAWSRAGAAGGPGAELAAARCAESAWRYLTQPELAGRPTPLEAPVQQALRLYNACAERWLQPRLADLVTDERVAWRVRASFPVGDVRRLRLARDAPVAGFRSRQRQDGIGVPLLPELAPGDRARPHVLPIGAVLRFDADRRVVVELHDGFDAPRVATAFGPVPVAVDFTAAYAAWADRLPGPFTTTLDLLRPEAAASGPRIELLQPYDPERVPVILIHGLASGPRTWLNLANDLLGDPRLASRYQVWICRYASSLPLLANRAAIQARLDALVRELDPEGDDPGLQRAVLIGHSMGGVLARLLVSTSGDRLWSAAFATPPTALEGRTDDVEAARALFFFEPWLPATRVVMLAAPHGGSPTAVSWIGRLSRRLVRLPPDTFGFLVRLAQTNPLHVRELVRESYLGGGPKSIDTLSPSQPVVVAARTLPVREGVRLHTLAGVADPDRPEDGDGVVPLASTVWPGVESELRVVAGHDLHRRPEAILEIKRILLAHAGLETYATRSAVR